MEDMPKDAKISLRLPVALRQELEAMHAEARQRGFFRGSLSDYIRLQLERAVQEYNDQQLMVAEPPAQYALEPRPAPKKSAPRKQASGH